MPTVGLAALSCVHPDGLLLLQAAATLILAGAIPAFTRNGPQDRESAAVRKVASMLNRSADLRWIAETALDEILAVHAHEAGILRLFPLNEGVREISAVCGLPYGFADLIPPSGPGWLMPGRYADFAEAPPSDPLRTALQKEGFRCCGILPLRSADRELGRLFLASRKHPPESGFREDFVCAIAEVLAAAATNAGLRDRAAKQAEDFIALQEVNKIISRSFDLEEIIRRIVVEGKRLVKTSACHLFLVDDRRHLLVGSASTQAQDIRSVELELSENSAATKALAEKRVISVQDIASGDGPGRRHLAGGLDWQAAIFVPLLTQDQGIGVLICSDDSPERAYTPEQIQRAETLGHQATIALENARLFQVVSRSQKEWETTFDAMQDCVSVHDLSGKVIRANLALARRLNTIPQKIIGKSCFSIYSAAAGSSLSCRHMEALTAESLIVEEIEIPSMCGTFQLSVSPWYDKNNRFAG